MNSFHGINEFILSRLLREGREWYKHYDRQTNSRLRGN
jgi:hypothetical protein